MLTPQFEVWFGRDIARRSRLSLRDERDVHSHLMQAYPEVPRSWYAGVGVISLIFLSVSIHLFPTQFPIWAGFFAYGLVAILVVPVAMIQAITNQSIQLNFLFEMIAGFMLPGRPVANMIFKAVGYVSTAQAIGFAGDLKLGHYMKIPPRMMFSVQIVSVVISCFVCVLQQIWMFANIVDFCLPRQKNGFFCPATDVFGTSSLIWGGIGPKRMFGPGGM
jgi:OPT family oligopeptide transporter